MAEFSDQFRQDFDRLLRWRRDVRRFRPDPVDRGILRDCFASFPLSPSVGLLQPWRLVQLCSAAMRGAGLGTGSMPEMQRYSVVSAITQFWLLARANGLGVGWVSILDPERPRRDLDLPESWSLMAYLCIGWPQEATEVPELERVGWETRETSLDLLER